MSDKELPKLEMTPPEERNITGNYIVGPAALTIVDGERSRFINVVYGVKRTVMDGTSGGIIPAVLCLNDTGGRYYPIDPGGDLFFDVYGDGNGQFSSRGVKYKIRPLLPEEKPQYI